MSMLSLVLWTISRGTMPAAGAVRGRRPVLVAPSVNGF